LTPDVLNLLARAVKLYVDAPRQQVRLAIAMARHHIFNQRDESKVKDEKDEEIPDKNWKLKEECKHQKIELDRLVRSSQKELIEGCIKLYKFVDFLHARMMSELMTDKEEHECKYREKCPLKYSTSEPA
jgi:hypothetical protein